MADLTREQIESIAATAPSSIDEGCGCETCAHALTASALRQLLTATEWKPIDEAPKEYEHHNFLGPKILVRIDDWTDTYIARWDQSQNTWFLPEKQVWANGVNGIVCTHFFPLPPSPDTEGE